MSGGVSRKKVLVAGGAGFIGSHLCEALINRGCHVFCLDDFSTGSIDNIFHLIDGNQFTLIEHDINQPIDLYVDEIYNLACIASPKQYQLNSLKTLRTNIFGAINLLELAKKNNAKILQTSTSEVYGDPTVHPQPESYNGNVNPVGIRSCYDEGKRCAETLFYEYRKAYGIDVKIARIFNTYGPKMQQDDGRVVSNFIVSCINSCPISIYGDGLQTRSFCYVDDTIDALLKLMSSKGKHDPINIGNNEEITILGLAQAVLKITNSDSELSFSLLPEDDPRKRCPDIQLAMSELNWLPATPLELGLSRTVNYFQNLSHQKCLA